MIGAPGHQGRAWRLAYPSGGCAGPDASVRRVGDGRALGVRVGLGVSVGLGVRVGWGTA